MLLRNRLIYFFTKDNLNKLKAYKHLKPIVKAEQKLKQQKQVLDLETKIPHSWTQYYFTPFLVPLSLLGYSIIANQQMQQQLVNIVTGSVLLPFGLTNILFYYYPFKNTKKSNIFKLVNVVAGAATIGTLYFYPTQPLISLFTSLGINALSATAEYLIRIDEQNQQLKVHQNQIDFEPQFQDVKRHRMQMMLIVIRFFCAFVLIMNLTLYAQNKYKNYNQLPNLQSKDTEISDNNQK